MRSSSMFGAVIALGYAFPGTFTIYDNCYIRSTEEPSAERLAIIRSREEFEKKEEEKNSELIKQHIALISLAQNAEFKELAHKISSLTSLETLRNVEKKIYIRTCPSWTFADDYLRPPLRTGWVGGL